MDKTTIPYLLVMLAICICIMCFAYSRMRNELYHQMLITAIFRYRTDCYMKDLQPAIDLDVISSLPYGCFHWKHMVPKDCYYILKPYMEEIKNDPRFH